MCIAWVFFRAKTFGDAGRVLEGMFTSPGETVLETRALLYAYVGIAIVVVTHHFMRDVDVRKALPRVPSVFRGVLIGLLFVLCLWASGEDRAFLYFQF